MYSNGTLPLDTRLTLGVVIKKSAFAHTSIIVPYFANIANFANLVKNWDEQRGMALLFTWICHCS